MKKLIICEKPSLAKNVANGIALLGERPIYNKDKGYTESDSFIISNAFGHLFELYDIEEYKPDYDQDKKYYWDLNGLPFVPENFNYRLKKDYKTKKTDTGIKKQFKLLCDLINDKNVDTIVNCGDADREGEVIVRIILEQAKNTKPVKRLWLPDQTEQSIATALKNLKDGKDYDKLADEGYARTYIDWLNGINLTRYATLKSGSLLKVGRVKSAIVRAIYDRDKDIKNFVPVPYYVVESDVDGIALKFKTKFQTAEEAQAKANELNNKEAIVKDINQKEKKISSPKLFSLSTLQNKMSKTHNLSPSDTLKTVQKLYESGYVSYPRTNTEYMATAEKEKVALILNAINDDELIFKDNKRVFDDSKIESHSAITPTTKIPPNLEGSDLDVYNTILNRCKANFCKEEHIIKETTAIVAVGEDTFEIKGNALICLGWKKYEQEKIQETIMPNIQVGDVLNTAFNVNNKQTEPPKLFTVETLNNYLKNPFKNELKETENDDDEYKALLSGSEIGTEATRAGIIEDCIKSNYISLTKTTYNIKNDGVYYIETLSKLNIATDTETTVELNKKLKDVYLGATTINSVVEVVSSSLQETMAQDIVIEKNENQEGTLKCPKCSATLPPIKNRKAVGCKECDFIIWRKLSGKDLTDKQIEKLITNGKTEKIKGFKSKAGKEYEATIVLDEDCKISFSFN